MQNGRVIQCVVMPDSWEARLATDQRCNLGAALGIPHQLGQVFEIVAFQMREHQPGELQAINDGVARVEASSPEERQIELASVVGDEWENIHELKETRCHSLPGSSSLDEAIHHAVRLDPQDLSQESRECAITGVDRFEEGLGHDASLELERTDLR